MGGYYGLSRTVLASKDRLKVFIFHEFYKVNQNL